MQKWIAEGRIFFPPGGRSVPRLKRYLKDVQKGIVPLTVWTYDEVGHTDSARKALKEVFHDQHLPFDNPKAVGLLEKIFTVAADKDAIILDSFAGSGTTAHTVLALNKRDGGSRKFILVECEDYADETTAERVRRVINGVPKAKNEDLKKGLGGQFTYMTLGDALDPDKILSDEKAMPSWDSLARHVFWLATGETLSKAPRENKRGFVGKSKKGENVYLIYKPDLAFMQSNEAMLTGKRVDDLGELRKKNERAIVYAAGAYVSLGDMRRAKVLFCQLPWAIIKRAFGE